MNQQPFSWTCPHCNQPTTITDQNVVKSNVSLSISNVDGERQAVITFIVCPNPTCNKYSLTLDLHEVEKEQVTCHNSPTPITLHHAGKALKHWQLVPENSGIPLPSYIPAPIVNDYREACLIRDLSPKSSATLARRALQGILRDYFKVNTNSLFNEINQIQTKVGNDVWDAIDSVRKVGNIGAHMEKDINIVIDVDPQEAQLLIGVIEMLIKETYVMTHERHKHLKAVQDLANSKSKMKQTNP